MCLQKASAELKNVHENSGLCVYLLLVRPFITHIITGAQITSHRQPLSGFKITFKCVFNCVW